jgi:hypothetical protein
LTGIAAELGLDVELPRVLAGFLGGVEYGLVERAYAQRNPKDFAALVDDTDIPQSRPVGIPFHRSCLEHSES